MANVYWTMEKRHLLLLLLSLSLIRRLGPQDLSGVPLNICNNKSIRTRHRKWQPQVHAARPKCPNVKKASVPPAHLFRLAFE